MSKISSNDKISNENTPHSVPSSSKEKVKYQCSTCLVELEKHSKIECITCKICYCNECSKKQNPINDSLPKKKSPTSFVCKNCMYSQNISRKKSNMSVEQAAGNVENQNEIIDNPLQIKLERDEITNEYRNITPKMPNLSINQVNQHGKEKNGDIEMEVEISSSNDRILDMDQLHVTVTPPSELYDHADNQLKKSK